MLWIEVPTAGPCVCVASSYMTGIDRCLWTSSSGERLGWAHPDTITVSTVGRFIVHVDLVVLSLLLGMDLNHWTSFQV